MVLISISLIYIAAYTGLILYYHDAWQKTPDFRPESRSDHNDLPFLSVIIAARNEADFITACLKSIRHNRYPDEKYEIIVVDDHSTDGTAEIVRSCNISNLKLIAQKPGQYGKKAAIDRAVEVAVAELLIFTDADCMPGSGWLEVMAAAFRDEEAKMLTGPVIIRNQTSLTGRFQQLDLAATMGITAVALQNRHFPLANGANMAYRKSFYKQAGGMLSHAFTASGDDVFMAEKAFNPEKNTLRYVKSPDAIVQTKAEQDLPALMRQRARWAGKARYYKNQKMNLLHAVIFGYVSLIPLNVIAGLWMDHRLIPVGLSMFFIKMALDYRYLSTLCRWFHIRDALKSYPLSAVFYMLHILYSGISAVFFPSASSHNKHWK